jgi:hypothetical protein
MDVAEARKHFDTRAAAERAPARARGVPLIAGYLAGVLSILALGVVMYWLG